MPYDSSKAFIVIAPPSPPALLLEKIEFLTVPEERVAEIAAPLNLLNVLLLLTWILLKLNLDDSKLMAAPAD